MANGTYGIRKPANITSSDVEIFYYYRPTRGSEAANFSEWKSLSVSSVFSECYFSGATLPGMYNLRLPLEQFGKKGIYTVYIKPREIETKIYDVSTLSGNYTGIRGIVIETSGLIDDDIVGYRVEYFGENKERLPYYRIITSSNRCEPVSQSAGGNTMQKSVRYRFNDSSNLLFCTLTPSTALSFKSSDIPVIGKTGQTIRLINTKFNPVMLEIEMTDHDVDTISTMLEGGQVRNLDNGIITTFDEDGNIYHQAKYGRIINPDTGMHSDFKIPYTNSFIKTEEGKYVEIKEQLNEQV